MSVLKSCKWSKPALRLLEATKELDLKKPAILHIRHTERTTALRDPSYNLNKPLSTDNGKKAATEFGTLLPNNRRYKLFNTWVDRSRETAEEIHKGILSSGAQSEFGSVIPYRSVVNVDEQAKWMQSQKIFDVDGAYDITCQWISGLVPTTTMKPSLEVAQKYAQMTVENLEGASPKDFHVYVTHDTTVLTLLFHWFGLTPYSDGCRFLEGFLLQLGDDGLRVWLRDKDEVYPYPHWWPK